MDYLNELLAGRTVFFNYMQKKYEVHYKSNIFLRDILYAIRSYYESKGKKLGYGEAEKLAYEFAFQLEKDGQLQLVGKNTWKVNFSLNNAVTELTD